MGCLGSPVPAVAWVPRAPRFLGLLGLLGFPGVLGLPTVTLRCSESPILHLNPYGRGLVPVSLDSRPGPDGPKFKLIKFGGPTPFTLESPKTKILHRESLWSGPNPRFPGLPGLLGAPGSPGCPGCSGPPVPVGCPGCSGPSTRRIASMKKLHKKNCFVGANFEISRNPIFPSQR